MRVVESKLCIALMLTIMELLCANEFGVGHLLNMKGGAKDIESYDYIIVGGGTAGSVLANRLTNHNDKNVLVLEAGSDDFENKYINIPAGVLRLFKNPKFDWFFESSPEPNVNNRGIYLCRGKVLGGSSCLNVQLYTRGDANDYNAWHESACANDWSPDHLLDYFKKSENHFSGESKFHGVNGEFSVSQVPYQNILSKTFLEGCKLLGIQPNNDFNDWSHSQEGYGRFHVFQKDGVRVSAATGFLKPVLNRKNLKIITKALVSKIDIDDGLKTTGVQYIKSGKSYQAHLKSNGEVLLTGGAINSPQILLLSGVGPKQQLENLGIKVVQDLPGVGMNLQDHPATVLSYNCAPGNIGVSTSSKFRLVKGLGIPNPKALFDWAFKGKGPFTSTGCDHGAYVKSREDLTSPDLQLRFVAAKAISPDGMSTLTKFKSVNNLEDGFSVQSLVARPLSKGSVELKSSNPFDKPIIKTGYFSDERDLESMREGIKLSRKIVSTPAFDKFRGAEVFPGSHVQSDEDLNSYIRETVHTANALVGTCKMGYDETSVVDAKLKVHGISGLRVIDSSVMPKIPGGQGAAPTVLIAEKGADYLLNGE